MAISFPGEGGAGSTSEEEGGAEKWGVTFLRGGGEEGWGGVKGDAKSFPGVGG